MAHKEYEMIYEKILQSETIQNQLIDEVLAWEVTHGLIMGNDANTYIPAPITLLPNTVEAEEFLELCELAPIFNILVDKISRDSDMVIKCIEGAANGDEEFTGRMLNLYKQWNKLDSSKKQKYQLGIFRSDYMRCKKRQRWSQIELNTIAASFGALSDRTIQLHNFLLQRHIKFQPMDIKNTEKRKQHNNEEKHQEIASNIYRPPSHTHEQIAEGLAAAAKLIHPNDPLVVMIVQPNEKNSSDQRMLEYALWYKYQVKTIRRTLLDVYATGEIDEQTNELILNKEIRVSTVYYRAGYTPKDYPSEKEWIGRERIEFSNAIKCPSVGHHLLGCKLMQVVFATPKILEKYLTEAQSEAIRKCFVGLWSLDNLLASDEEIKETLIRTKKDYDRYVLKPQREGGGNNYYGKDIPKLLETLEKEGKKELSSYIVMERIFPNEKQTIQLRNKEKYKVTTISELGIYSCILSDGKTEVINKAIGSLMRTKQKDVSEGGVASGHAVLDSFLLVNAKKPIQHPMFTDSF